jgi:hypothetical protein
MKKYFFLIVLFALCAQQNAFSRNWLKKGVDPYFPLKEILQNHSKSTLGDLKDSLNYEMKNMAALQKQILLSQTNISRIANAMNIPVLANPANPAADMTQVNQSIGSVKLYGAILLLLLLFLGFRVYTDMRMKLQTTTQVLDSQITLAKHDLEKYIYQLEKEAINIDNRLVQVLHQQLSIIKEDRAARIMENPIEQFIPVTDHRLPVKVGEEVHRMKKRIENMDKEVKGLGALVNSIKRLEEELKGNGYEMEELMGKKYVDGMKMEARFVDNPDIPPGEERITDVLRPEIKYKGEVIQVAKVEVGKSYE